jgi:uncharacterized protein (TIGR03032 family)
VTRASSAKTKRPAKSNGKPDAAQVAVDFRSIGTDTFPPLLSDLAASLIVSTYQAGRVVLVRAETRSMLNTGFREFYSPMGIAVRDDTIAIGTAREIWDFRDDPELAARLAPDGRYDACFLPRNLHVSGDFRIHELGFAGDELWGVNTRFSTLCTFDLPHSFVPRWRPPFVSELAPEDRCHLNGMAIHDGVVRMVTVLGQTNTKMGWRDRKADGGAVIDVASGETVLRGLCMPHSPRVHQGHFWVLESGKGTLAQADLATGRVETIAELPGFTRGLAFAGPYAFVGLSQIRESTMFGGLPLVERVPERSCGIWVVDLRDGSIVAALRFEGLVQEIFDVQVLHGLRYPQLCPMAAHEVGATYVIPGAELTAVTDAA